MAIYVNTNISSLNGRRYLNNVQNQLTTTYQRLSSGLRINSAKDDAAGLQISSRLTTQINGLNQGNRNANDGIAFAQTAEGAMDEITGMLQKVRTLAVQANNGTNTTEDKKALSAEVDSLLEEVQRVVQQTTFGGKSILNGQQKNSLYGIAANGGAAGNDAKISFQVGANSGDTIELTMKNLGLSKVVATNDLKVFGIGNANGTIDFSFTKADSAPDKVLEKIDGLIALYDGERATLGAFQNRLESSIRNQANVSANQADARSRIRDADFAEESANLSQQSIIQQAATSMLMQANTRPMLGLALLG
ncbi:MULTISPECIES: flagellin [unclassified Anaerobiospirillum]|uniref:flagellin N-terminal helical domain-containing protein n=1 Tax=unclassified Anaerobiospirillum TaxID=2647410 RepID=UPI001FF10E18|nr:MULTISPECIES: flagellin [unclassified Anaerobiospirillum]MCK0527185.1 flagellin [Anaerobiospirillum sp. NML120449]MCK0539506.1 flagellin [Anaerobiospirillum sp. NML02-A-032]